MDPDRVERRSFTLPLRCNYLLHTPEPAGENARLVIAVHGHAMTPEQMLRLTARLVGEEHYIASLQGPYQLWVDRKSVV